jgi:hypothetical protein
MATIGGNPMLFLAAVGRNDVFNVIYEIYGVENLIHVNYAIFVFLGWDFWHCGHYWPIVPAPDDM